MPKHAKADTLHKNYQAACLKKTLSKQRRNAGKTWLLVTTQPSAFSQKWLWIATSLQFPERRLAFCEVGTVMKKILMWNNMKKT